MRYEQFYSKELEVDVLGTIINFNEVLDKAMMLLDVDCFYITEHKELFNIINKLYKENESIDIANIFSSFNKDIKISITYASEISSQGITAFGFEKKCEKLIKYKKLYIVYKLKEKLNKMLEEEAPLGEFQKIIDSCNNDLITESLQEKDNGVDILENTLKIIEDESINKINNSISTGYLHLDDMIFGLSKKEMVVIAGRPGSGKTTLITNLALNIIKQEKYVALYSLEMSKVQLMKKILSSISLVDYSKIMKKEITKSDMEKLTQSKSKLHKMMKYINIYDKKLHLNDIVAQSKLLKKQGKLDVLMIDYMQLAEAKNTGNNREQEIAHISRTLKRLSQELDINVIALSQLSRACEQRNDHRPILSDLRESGSIEQDSTVVLMCYRDEYYNKDTEEKNIIEIICNKNRNGQTGTIKLSWLPTYQLIDDILFNDNENAPF